MLVRSKIFSSIALFNVLFLLFFLIIIWAYENKSHTAQAILIGLPFLIMVLFNSYLMHSIRRFASLASSLQFRELVVYLASVMTIGGLITAISMYILCMVQVPNVNLIIAFMFWGFAIFASGLVHFQSAFRCRKA